MLSEIWREWRRIAVVTVSSASLVVGSSPAAHAQTFQVEGALQQSYTSVDPLSSPTGFRVGASLPALWGRFGLQLGYRQITDGGDRIDGYCGLFCVTGPFDTDYVMRTTDVGVIYQLLADAEAQVYVGLVTSLTSQKQRLEHLETGEKSSRGSVGPDLGFGVVLDARAGPILLGIRPLAYLRYDRVGASTCLADASCFGGRHVASLGLGGAWQLP